MKNSKKWLSKFSQQREEELKLLQSLGNKSTEPDEIVATEPAEPTEPVEPEGTDDPTQLPGLEALKKDWKAGH